MHVTGIFSQPASQQPGGRDVELMAGRLLVELVELQALASAHGPDDLVRSCRRDVRLMTVEVHQPIHRLHDHQE